MSDDVAVDSSAMDGNDNTEVESSEQETTDTSEAPAKRRLKCKVDDQEIEVDEDEIVKDYQKYKAADKKFMEAANIRKQAAEERALVESFLAKAQQGDLSWLKGLVPKEQLTKFAEAELLAHIEYEQLSSAEKEALQAKQEAAELKRQLDEYNKSKEEAEIKSVEDVAYQKVEAEIVEAVQELGYDITRTPRFIRRMAEQMHASLDALPEGDTNEKPMSAVTARDRAWKGLIVDAREVLSILPDEEAIALLPPKLRSAIRKADVQDASGLPKTQRPRDGGDDVIAKTSRGKRVHMSTDDYFKKLEQKYKG